MGGPKRPRKQPVGANQLDRPAKAIIKQNRVKLKRLREEQIDDKQVETAHPKITIKLTPFGSRRQ